MPIRWTTLRTHEKFRQCTCAEQRSTGRRTDNHACRKGGMIRIRPSMRRQNVLTVALSAVLLSGSAWPAAAQSPEPYGGRVAIGGAIGGALPTADRLDNGFYAGASVLVSMASHVGLIAEAGVDRVAVNRPG